MTAKEETARAIGKALVAAIPGIDANFIKYKLKGRDFLFVEMGKGASPERKAWLLDLEVRELLPKIQQDWDRELWHRAELESEKDPIWGVRPKYGCGEWATELTGFKVVKIDKGGLTKAEAEIEAEKLRLKHKKHLDLVTKEWKLFLSM
jgi:hypothetical protein